MSSSSSSKLPEGWGRGTVGVKSRRGGEGRERRGRVLVRMLRLSGCREVEVEEVVRCVNVEGGEQKKWREFFSSTSRF